MKKRDFKDEIPAIQIVSKELRRELEEYYRTVISDDKLKISSLQ